MEKQYKHGDIYTCRRLKMVRFLRERGFLPFRTLPDKDNPAYNVWQYHNSVELEETIYEYFDLLKQGKIFYN